LRLPNEAVPSSAIRHAASQLTHVVTRPWAPLWRNAAPIALRGTLPVPAATTGAAEVPAAAAPGADGPEPDVAGALALHTKVTAVDAPW
jgi:hypothetical protein